LASWAYMAKLEANTRAAVAMKFFMAIWLV